MKVRINSKKQMFKAFLGWLPLLFIQTAFFCAIISFGLTLSLENILGISREEARVYAVPFALLLTIPCMVFYVRWFFNSLSSFVLEIKNEQLIVEGKDGWKKIQKQYPLQSIDCVYIGNEANVLEKMSAHHGLIQDQVASRIIFHPKKEKPFKIDFALKVFEHQSLNIFFQHLNKNGIKTNIGV